MITVPVVSSDPTFRARYLAKLAIPQNYMEDFSKLGFVVDRYEDSIALLRQAGYRLECSSHGASLHLDNAMHITKIRALFLSSSISCEYGDIADTFYQA